MATPRICTLLKMKPPVFSDRGYLEASGDTVPTDTTDGYATGCIFKHTDGGAETAVYVNEGSVTSCAFVPLLTTTSEAADLTDIGATTYGAGKILVADGDSYEEVAVSGDATLASTGALTVTGSTGAFAVGTNLSLTTGFFNIGEQGTGAAVATANPFAAEIHATVAADVVPGDTGSSAGVYSRYEVAADQTTQCSHISMFGKLRVKADLGDGTHAGMFGYVEISEVGTVIGGTATTTTAAGHFALESDTNFELSTGHLNGVCVDSSIHASATISGTMAGIRVKKSTGCLAWPTGITLENSACGTGISIGTCTGHLIEAATTSTWGTGIAGGAIAIGDYSNPVVFGTISEHLIGQVINISAAVDDDSNIIPMHIAFANTADCGANSVAQVVYARATLAYAISDCYSLRARLDITDATTPTVNQLAGVLSTVTTKACEIDTTGSIACYTGIITGTEDITTAASGPVCGIYLSWEEQNAMTADTNGVLVNVAASCRLDHGVVVHLDATGTAIDSSFLSSRSGGTITNALEIAGAHTNAFAFPAEGTAPTVDSATAMNGATSDGYIVVTVGGASKKMYYFA